MDDLCIAKIKAKMLILAMNLLNKKHNNYFKYSHTHEKVIGKLTYNNELKIFNKFSLKC